jgi:glycine oxidase
MSPERTDVVVVGGGVIGCALATELAARGRAVTVLERAEPGAEASGAAAGMLAPQAEARARDAFFDLALESRGLYPAWVRSLQEETGVEVGYRRTGLLHCDFAGAPAGSLAAQIAWQRAAGLDVVELRVDELPDELGGRLCPEVAAAAYFPEEGVVDPRRLTRAAWLLADRRGVRVRTGVAVLGFRIEGGVCRGVETDAGTLLADAVVDAAGAWAAFDSSLPLSVPVEPVRGQIVELHLRERPLSTILSCDDVYIVPRADGTVLLGSTVEHVGFRKEVTAEAVERLIAGAVRFVPELARARFVTAWSGLRPGTPDGLPILGPCRVPGLFFAAGHFRNGILLAPVTALAVADAVAGAGRRDLSPFSIERFSEVLRTA